MSTHTYQQSIHWMRSQPELQEMVKQCYLDEDTFGAAHRFANSEEFSTVAALLKLDTAKSPKRILDIGCGNGIAAYAFASLGHNVSAVDPDDSEDVGLAAIASLVDKLPCGSISAVKAFAEELPFSDAEFDVVYERQALHHFSDLSRGLKECARVLKPGGKLLATREHIVDDPQQLEVFLQEHILHKLHGGENAYPSSTYITALVNAGLRVDKCLKSYDSVINHFPLLDKDVEHGARQRLTNRLGAAVGSAVGSAPLAVSYHRRRASLQDKRPGRMYSFLCTKVQ